MKYGCHRDVIDHRDYLLNQKTLSLLPKVDLRLNCPVIYNQGNLGSCVANGTSFCIQFDQIKYHMTHQFVPSRLFIYYNTRVIEHTVDLDSGTTIRDALTAVNRQGACPEPNWPYVINRFAIKPSHQAYLIGAKHLVKLYARILFDLNHMKQCLVDGFPFLFGMMVYSSFDRVGPSGVVTTPTQSESVLGGHCMACVGYDDRKQSFIVRNSWGSNWGDRGYCYIPYTYMSNPKYTFDLWTIRTITDTEIKSVLYGKKNKYKVVTSIFVKYFDAGNPSMVVDNKLFGDPYYGVVKEIRITFDHGGVLVYPEHSIITSTSLTQPSTISTITTTNAIIKATYGYGSRVIDVTAIVKDQFSQGYPQITVSNQLFTDPYYGQIKQLRVRLANHQIKIYKEGSIVTINNILM